jgi:hypothetical protein
VPKNGNTRVRFLGGYAAQPDLLGVLSYPVALDEHEVEFTRFIMTNQQKWVQMPFELDIVSLTFTDSSHGKAWWLLGKRGQVISFNSAGRTEELISDAGTGPEKLGYVTSMRLIGGQLFACGYRRQIYERTAGSWQHRDAGILADKATRGVSLNDLEGGPTGAICAIGNHGEIAMQSGADWTMLDSPTNQHLYAICVDDSGMFNAVGANGTVIRGDESGFEVVCSENPGQAGALWDIECFQGDLIASASAGLFLIKNGSLQPFSPAPPATMVGYKLTSNAARLWSVGTHQIYCFDGNEWQEWVCPDNAP